jgi:hypothetical protein
MINEGVAYLFMGCGASDSQYVAAWPYAETRTWDREKAGIVIKND